MMTKRRFLSLISLPLMVAAVSCGPSVYTVDVELRQPSRSGMSLAGKSLSVVFVDNQDKADSSFIANVAESFADRLDKEYFKGDSLVGVFNIRPNCNNYTDRDSILNLLMETGSDVIFLFDKPLFDVPYVSDFQKERNNEHSYVVGGKFPFRLNLYAYDSMDKADTIRHFSDTGSAEAFLYAKGNEPRHELVAKLKDNLIPQAQNAGKQSGGVFMSQWKMETIPFFVYDSEKWYESAYAVEEYQWQKAMDIWMSLLSTKNMQKRACLEYNLAAACYMMSKYELALDWLKLSEADYDLPYSSMIRRKIKLGMLKK